MASEPSGDRATVALVVAKIEGMQALQQANFLSLQGQLDQRLGAIHKELDRLNDIPVKVAKLEGRTADQERRLDNLIRDGENTAEWRRGPALALVVAIVFSLVNLLIAAGLHV